MIPFVDMKAQYQALKTSIDSRIHKVLDHGLFILGPEVAECEKQLAEFTGSQYALTCASGTDALVMALMAAGVGPGDEVITTAFSFIATAESIVLVGAKPVYVDIEPDTYNLDVKLIEKAITPKTKAIMPVSMYGQVADMDEINQIAKKHKLTVIEDAAQSFGAEYKGKKSCNLSDIGCTSFFPAKPLGCYGDGGAVFTNDEKLADRLTKIRNHGQQTRYHHTMIGINGRLDTIQCAVLLAKMERYPWEIKRRQDVAQRFNAAFEGLTSKGVKLPKVRGDRTSVWAQYTLGVPNREAVQKKLQEKGIPTAVHYPSTMPEQPAYQGLGTCHKIDTAKTATQTVMSLPMHADLDDKTHDLIVKEVRAVLG